MKLLLDQNLSAELVTMLAVEFPGSDHIRLLGMERLPDREVWDYAARNGFVIVSKDSDFYALSALLGPPPQVIWLQLGNCPTSEVAAVLVQHKQALVEFKSSPSAGYFILGKKHP